MNQFPPSLVIYQQHRWQICHRCQQHWRQIIPPVSLVLLIPVANLPPASTIRVANNGNNYQTADNLKLTWRKKSFYMLTLLPKGVQRNYWNFSDEHFFHLPPVSTTPVVHLELRISPGIFEKILNGPNSTLQGQNTEISKQIFPEKEYRGLSTNFHIHMSVSDLYISTIGLPILLEEICRPILGPYKSVTDTWMWKLGMRPRYSQKRNTQVGFSLQCRNWSM